MGRRKRGLAEGKATLSLSIVSARPAWAAALSAFWAHHYKSVCYLHPGAAESHLNNCEAVVIDCVSHPSAERLVRAAAAHPTVTRVVTSILVPCDLVADRLRHAGAHAVVTDADTIESWSRALRPSACFVMSPSFGSGPRLLPLLTPRQREVYELVARGLTDEQVAEKLGMVTITAETHRSDVQQKLGCRSHADLVLHALRHGVIDATEISTRSAARQVTRRHCASARA